MQQRGSSSLGYSPYGAPSTTSSGQAKMSGASLPRQDFSHLPAFERCFYLEHPQVKARTAAEVDAYREKREM